jgi:hypothetical protein
MWEHIKNFWAEIWRNKMGGDNQSTLAPEKKATPEKVEILSMADAVESKKDKKSKKKKKKNKDRNVNQEIRQHVNNGECHWHVDAEGLKAAIPVADWTVMARQLKRMETIEYVDIANKSRIVFTPYINADKVLSIAIGVEGIEVSDHFDKVINLKK